MEEWIRRLLEHPDLVDDLSIMGHGQRIEDANLGLGWVYYSLARVIRPKRAIVIGSYRGFVPLVLGKALADNSEEGQVFFIDPSFADDFWKDPQAVRDHFTSFGVTNVRHFLMTSQQFVNSDAYRELDELGIVFVDGYHSEQQARFEYEAFKPLLAPHGVFLFHDSIEVKRSWMYGQDKAYVMRVVDLMDKLKRDRGLQVFDLPFDGGVTLVRKASAVASAVPPAGQAEAEQLRSRLAKAQQEAGQLRSRLAKAEQLRSRLAKAKRAEQDLVLLLRRLANSPLGWFFRRKKGFRGLEQRYLDTDS